MTPTHRWALLGLGLSLGCPAGDDADPGASSGGESTGSGGAASPATSAGTTAATEPSTSTPTAGTTTSTPTASSSGEAGSSGEETTGGPALPTDYEGYGAVTEGAHSCEREPDVVHVTSLENAGPGSLREAVSDGCREIVFDVGGTINLTDDLNVAFSYVTIDGSSAPDPGITIVQAFLVDTVIEARNSVGPAHDIIIHHLRMQGAGGHEGEGDIWGLDGENHDVYNIVLDHITASSASDGVFDIWMDVHDVTISWNLILDTETAMHLSTGDISVARERVSFHHNVLAGNNERQLRIRHNNGDIDYRNNVVYGWGWFEGGAAGLHIAYDDGETNPSMNVVGNVFHHVAGLAGDEGDAIRFERGTSEGSVFFADNIVPAAESDNVSTGAELSVPAEAQVTMYDASTLADDVVPFVGTQLATPDESTRLSEIAGAL